MPTITVREDYNGFVAKMERLGLTPVVDEVERVVSGFELRVKEERHANGTQGLRKELDARFGAIGGWSKIASGGIDWSKSIAAGGSIGVEVQVSGRSDMLAVDVLHLKEKLEGGEIDLGLIIVPDDSLSPYLTDRTPNLATAIRHVSRHANDKPIRIVAFRHDGAGAPLPKAVTNRGGFRPKK
jgi:hypothetical protein